MTYSSTDAESRRFRGKTFFLKCLRTKKSDALAEKRRIKRLGSRCRITKSRVKGRKGMYEVWWAW